MNAKLWPEQAAALHGEPSMEMVDPQSGKLFVLIEKSLHTKNIDAISRGLRDMEAGRGRPLDEAQQTSLDRLKQQHG